MCQLTYTIIALFILSICICCNDPKQDKSVFASNDSIVKKKLYDLLLKKTDYSIEKRESIMDSLKTIIKGGNTYNKDLFLYLNGVIMDSKEKTDSAMHLFNKMLNRTSVDSALDADIIILKSLGQLSVASNTWVDADLISRLQKVIKFAEKMHFKFIFEVYNGAAGIYFRFGDTLMTTHYLQAGYETYPISKSPSFMSYYFVRMASVLIAGKSWELASKYLDSCYQIALKTRDTVLLASTYEKKAGVYGYKGDLQSEIRYQDMAFSLWSKAGILNSEKWTNQALNFFKKGELHQAIEYFHHALVLATGENNLYSLQDDYTGLYAIYRSLKRFDSAVVYLDSSHQMNAKIFLKREADKVADITLKYEQEKKDEKITQLNKQATLQQKILSQQKLIISILVIAVVAIILSFIGFFRRRKLRLANVRIDAERNQLLLEQQLLRSQIQPHFIYNTLSSLQSLIRHGQSEKAISYVGKFGGILRLSLKNSREKFALLKDEIEALENYLSLQKMSYGDIFDYEIDIYDDYDEDEIMIPPMLLQPFVENAVMHGMHGLQHRGKITVIIWRDDLLIYCIIEDNGAGLSERKGSQHNSNSLATTITKTRLEKITNQTGQPTFLSIENISGQQTGVRVRLHVPFVTNL